MSKMKKLLAMVLALAMVLGMSMTTMAAIAVPSGSDKADIIVTGLPAGATVTAYQIVDATYDSTGFKEYVAVSGASILNPKRPTADEVSAIARTIADRLAKNQPAGFESKGLVAQADGSYSVEAEAGYWLILVDPLGYYVFNPMLAGVYYKNTDGSGNTITSDTIDSKLPWSLFGTTAEAKQSETNITKEIVDPSTDNVKGDDVAIGEEIQFKVTTDIPVYDKESYVDVTFKVTDTLANGISFLKNPAIVVTVNGTEVDAGATTYSATINGQVLTVDFVDSYIFAHGGEGVVITYKAALNENALHDNNPNDNKVELTYTRKPGEDTKAVPKITHHYTFDFTVVKKDDSDNLLPGATFTLTSVADGTTKTAVSDAYGNVYFKGLDVGQYTLQETDAPDGFQLDSTVHNVVIEATYDQDGVMLTYSITVDGVKKEDGTVGTVTVENLASGSQNVETATVTLVNTRLIELPSTGGIGTTMFTIGGCGIMIAAAYLFFASRKREEA